MQAQDFMPPDYRSIEKAIADPASNLYYPKLLTRFKDSDTTMTLDEIRHLYYGYTFRDEYSPYRRNTIDSLYALIAKENHSPEELNQIIRFSDVQLKENPFDVDAIFNKVYCYDELGKPADADKCILQAAYIYKAITSSGDGKSKETAFYVINTRHEYNIMRWLGLKPEGQALVEHYDLQSVAENEYGINSLYFDVSPCLNSLKKQLKNKN
jgi:hypothetical protein